MPLRVVSCRAGAAAVVAFVAASAAVLPAAATVTSVTSVVGSASGYRASVSLFGGPANTRGPAPSVVLPASGSTSAVTASLTSASAVVGPAIFFSSDAIAVSTQGSTGPSGSVTSSSSITNVNTSGQESLTAATLSSTCTASGSGATASTALSGASLFTDNGNDLNGDGDYIDAGEHPPVSVPLAASPAPNTTIDGHIHVNGSVDSFRYVFNEQIVNADGSITVHGVHEYLLGPTAVGDVYLATSICGVTLTVASPTSSPVITSADHATFAVGSAGSFTVTTTAGYPAATVISKTGTLPGGVTFTDNGDGTATIAGTPTEAGSFPVTITASNGASTDATQSFTLNASSTPVITSADHTTFTVGSAGSFTVTTTPGYPAATTITKTGALPAGVSFTDNGDGTATLAGTPAAGTAGSYPLTVSATNAAGSTPQSFTLTVGAAAQSITFEPPADQIYGAAPFTVSPTASSGLTVSLASSTTSVCTVSGFTVTIVAVGTCTLTASQAGNGNWQAAQPVSRTFIVGYTITNLAPPNKSTFKAGSTIPVKFQLVGADGAPIPSALARSLAVSCAVKVSFNSGPAVCATYKAKSQQFQANLSTPSNLHPRTAYPILITITGGPEPVTVATAIINVTAK